MLLKQSTVRNRTFKMISSTDHLSLKTGASPVVNIAKNGAAFGAAAGAVSEIANGWYQVALTTVDTGTLGDLSYYVTGTGADDTDFADQVVVNLLGDTLPANVLQWNSHAVPAENVNGEPLVDVNHWRGTQPATLNNTLVQSDTERWLNGVPPTPITTGVPIIDWIPSGWRQNTAQAGAAGSITLDAGASATDAFYKYSVIALLGGTGAGQARLCTGYTGSTKVATIAPNWTTNPDATSKFSVLPLGLADVETWLASAVGAAAAGVPDVNVKNYNAVIAQTDANNLPKVDVEDWKAGVVPAPNVTGEPLVDLNHWRGTQPSTLNNNLVQVDVERWLNAVMPAVNVAGVPKVDLVDWLGVAPNALQSGMVQCLPVLVRAATAQAGAATTITLDASASATTDFYRGEILALLSGTGAGQSRICTAYNGGTKVATVDRAWATNPDATTVFAVLGITDILLGSDGKTLISTDAQDLSASLSVNAKAIAGVAAVLDANNFLKVDTEDWQGQPVVSPNIAGVPQVDVNRWQGTPVANATDGGFIQALPSVLSQTAQAGSTASTIKLHAGASATDDFYKGWWVYLTAGTGSGQIRFIASYVGATKVATIFDNWLTTPDATTHFVLMPRTFVDLGYWQRVQPNALAQGKVDAANVVRTGTAQANAGDPTSIKLDAGASATDNFYNDQLVLITSGTGAGLHAFIYSYAGATKIASVKPNFLTAPDATSTFIIFPSALADQWGIKGAILISNVSGQPDVNVSYWNSGLVPSPNLTGRPLVDVTDWLGTAPNALISGRVDSNAQVVGDKTGYALTAGERNAIADAFLVRTLGAEGYAAKGAVPTVAQALFMLLQNMQEMAITGTTVNIKKLDGSTVAMTLTLDSGTTPTSRTRAT